MIVQFTADRAALESADELYTLCLMGSDAAGAERESRRLEHRVGDGGRQDDRGQQEVAEHDARTRRGRRLARDLEDPRSDEDADERRVGVSGAQVAAEAARLDGGFGHGASA